MSQDASMPSNERIEAHLRPILFPIAAASCVIFFWIAFTQEGDFRLALVLGAAIALTYCAYRFYREKRIVRDGRRVMALVTEYIQVPNSDGGSDRECKYRFTAADGREYVGHCESTGKDFPEEGCLIAIIYNQHDPSDNFPREMVWFYDI
jgi:hypothetical protein